MKKRYIFIVMLFSLAFLVIQLVLVGYRNSSREDLIYQRQREIQNDEQEIAAMTLRARWGDTTAARTYLKKLYQDVALPGERMIVLVPSETQKYSVEEEISSAYQQDREDDQLTIPEKWQGLFSSRKI